MNFVFIINNGSTWMFFLFFTPSTTSTSTKYDRMMRSVCAERPRGRTKRQSSWSVVRVAFCATNSKNKESHTGMVNQSTNFCAARSVRKQQLTKRFGNNKRKRRDSFVFVVVCRMQNAVALPWVVEKVFFYNRQPTLFQCSETTSDKRQSEA